VSKAIAILGSALFFVVAPLVLAGFVPWWITHWEFRPAFFGLELTRAIGLMLIIAGVPGVVDSFARFALQGLGTPAPIPDTEAGGHGSLSLRAKSDLRRGRCCHFLSSTFIRRLAPPLVCRAALALFPRLRLGVRRTNAQADIWRAVRGLSGQCPALGSTADPMASPVTRAS